MSGSERASGPRRTSGGARAGFFDRGRRARTRAVPSTHRPTRLEVRLRPFDPREDELVERFCEPAAAAICAAHWRCCDTPMPSCLDDVFAACTREVHEEAADRWNVGLEVSPEGLAATLAEIDRAMASCLDVDLEIARWYWFREAVGLGEPCLHGGVACRGGACARPSGVCQLRPGIGEPVLDGRCREGLVSRTGDRCGRAARAGGSCGADEDCADGLVCPDDRCVALGRAGARCELAEDCAVGLDCLEGPAGDPIPRPPVLGRIE